MAEAYYWTLLYLGALQETEDSRILRTTQLVMAALVRRMRDLGWGSYGPEQRAITTALSDMHVLHRACEDRINRVDLLPVRFEK